MTKMEEEIVMEDDVEVEDEVEVDETPEETPEDEAMYGPGVADLVGNALEQKPLEFQQTFNDLLQQRIADAVETRKVELAAGLAGAHDETDETEVDDGEVEAADDEGEEDDSEE